jgi:hypothetical protein
MAATTEQEQVIVTGTIPDDALVDMWAYAVKKILGQG